jgi:hypothetical protein
MHALLPQTYLLVLLPAYYSYFCRHQQCYRLWIESYVVAEPFEWYGRVSFDLVPFNIPYNASALRHTSKWSYTASISTPSKFTANSKLITELSVSWPDGEGPGAKDYNWAVCVVHLPDIMNFGAGPGINGCNTAIIEDLITISAAKAILPLVCGGIASFPVPHVCKGAMA